MNQQGRRADVHVAMELVGKKKERCLCIALFSCARHRLEFLNRRPVIGRCRFQRNNVASGLQCT